MLDYSGNEEPSDVQKVIKQISIQASRGGGNVNQIINQNMDSIVGYWLDNAAAIHIDWFCTDSSEILYIIINHLFERLN